MLTWAPWKGESAAWDTLLAGFADYSIYQCHAWGEHRCRFGWTALRLTASEDERTIAIAQVLVRRFPLGVRMAWVPGGPIGRIDSWGQPLRSAIARETGARHLYCRVYPLGERIGEDQERMVGAGWRQVASRINSGLTLVYELSEDSDARARRASGNWRHNLRRSAKYGHSVTLWQSPDPDEMLGVYATMEAHKGLREQFSRQALASILAAFEDRCVVVRCDDRQGRLLAFRGALLLGRKGWDIFAAATPDGRKVYASHAAFWGLMNQCEARGILWYDMSGADKAGSKGVYDFKKGTGAVDLEYLGEWDWATSPLLRRAANRLIKHRAGAV